MQPENPDSSVPVDHPSIGSGTQDGLGNVPSGNSQDATVLSAPPDTQSPPKVQQPSGGGATAASHLVSPHPTSAEAPAGQAILKAPSTATTATTTAVTTGSPHGNMSEPGSVQKSSRRLSASSSKMLFSDLYKSTKLPLSRLRQHPHAAPATSDYDPDLLSKDKIKQKDAVKRFLAARIRNDWEFKWPPPSEPSHTVGTQAGADETVEQGSAGDDAEKEDQATDATDSHEAVDNAIGTDTDSGHDDVSTYSTVSEDPDHFRSRTEWLSDLSDDDEPFSPSAYRFDNPEGVGIAVKANELARSANRRRAARAEMQWNAGLACFNARRDAWTGAKVARVRPKPPSSVPTSPSKRLSFWGRISTPTSPVDAPATSPLSPTATRTSGDTTAVSCSDTDGKEANTKKDSSTYPIQTLLPLAPPILPPANPMRSSITPASYPSIYDKIVVQTMTPACPVNLVDVIRACVTGWKRDGEWPPRSTIVAPVVAVKKKQRRSAVGENDKRDPGRRMSFNFLGRRHSAAGGAVPAGIMHPSQPVKVKDGDKEKENAGGGAKKIFRKSLQRVLGLGLGQDHERARGVDHTNNAGPGPSPGPMTNGI